MSEIHFFGEYTFELHPMVLMRGIEVIDLPQKQLEILAALLRAQGDVVTRDTFLETVWKDVVVEEHNLTQTVFLLRKSLGKLPTGEDYIETVPKRGYRMSPGALASQSIRPSRNAPPVDRGHSRAFPTPPLQDGQVAATMRMHGRTTSALFLAAVAVIVIILAVTAGRLYSQYPRLRAVKQLTRDGIRKEARTPVLLQQGSLIFAELRGNRPSLASVSVNGGAVNASGLSGQGTLFESSNSAGDDLLISDVERDGPIMSATFQGNASHAIGNLVGRSASLSPDGKQIVYISEQQLMLSDSFGQHSSVLVKIPGIPFWPSWSPDGREVRFSVREAVGRQTIYEFNLATRSLRPIFKVDDAEGRHACCGSWSRDGRYFVYVVEGPLGSAVWVRQEKLFGWRAVGRSWEVASGPVDFWRSPMLSEDLHHLYLVGEQVENHVNYLSLVNRSAEPFINELPISSLSVSRDGQWLAYTLHPQNSLWKSRLDGSERVQLSAPGEVAQSPQWTSDGALIYMKAVEGGWSVARIDATGAKSNISNGTVNDLESIAYTPIGERVAFNRQPGPSNVSDGIYILSLGNRQVETVPDSVGLSLAKWSPDARYLSALNANRNQIKLYDEAARSWHTVASSSPIAAQAWNRDGNMLYFVVDRDGRHLLMKYEINDARTTQVMEIPGRIASGDACKVLEATPVGDLLFGCSQSTSEIYDVSVDVP